MRTIANSAGVLGAMPTRQMSPPFSVSFRIIAAPVPVARVHPPEDAMTRSPAGLRRSGRRVSNPRPSAWEAES
ncbi:MAG: hypothetical protein ACAH79_05105, partial [Thermoleophilia bacterium]